MKKNVFLFGIEISLALFLHHFQKRRSLSCYDTFFYFFQLNIIIDYVRSRK
jgi:hypothetical protein